MEKLFILAYFLMIMLDKVVISDARRLLLDFLIGERNRKNAKKNTCRAKFFRQGEDGIYSADAEKIYRGIQKIPHSIFGNFIFLNSTVYNDCTVPYFCTKCYLVCLWCISWYKTLAYHILYS